MRLPEAEKAEISEAKIKDYLLSDTHPVGRHKAAFFVRHGFSRDHWERLAEALREHATEHDVAGTEINPFGERDLVEGALGCPDGTRPDLRSVWILDSGGTIPRFVTAYPIRRSSR